MSLPSPQRQPAATNLDLDTTASPQTNISTKDSMPPSLSIKTANGRCVSLLNDASVDCSDEPKAYLNSSSDNDDETGGSSAWSTSSTPVVAENSVWHKRSMSISGNNITLPSIKKLSSTWKDASLIPPAPKSAPLPKSAGLMRPPSLSINTSFASTASTAVSSAASTPTSTTHFMPSSASPCSLNFSRPPLSAPPTGVSMMLGRKGGIPANATVTKTIKRKYKCPYAGCDKAFTTSGHLARHHRIHTGEKNFACPFPGCQSRFSRQDNMMQHYRTHLSAKSRRNNQNGPRKVVFMEPMVDPSRPSPHHHHHSHHAMAGSPTAAYAGATTPRQSSTSYIRPQYHHPYQRSPPPPPPPGVAAPPGHASQSSPLSADVHNRLASGPGAPPALPSIHLLATAASMSKTASSTSPSDHKTVSSPSSRSPAAGVGGRSSPYGAVGSNNFAKPTNIPYSARSAGYYQC
ncbi:transcriptional repressor [Mycoemilia scoparia]|uniref:Transcriptional repressor n=1 Tax=Mycoemilia scoparia TaxID=417184 RepID=A0A9W8DS59_9FUNG|nr:transcriptional repressor [Mycoemilia scoparia]